MGDLSDFQRGTAFSWSVCNQHGNFIRCIPSSSVQGHNGIHKSWKDIISYEEEWPKTKIKGKGSLYIEEDCAKNYRITAAKVRAELNVHLEDPVSTITVLRELHKFNIHGRAAMSKPLISEQSAKRRKR
jgi:hypothetical protein